MGERRARNEKGERTPIRINEDAYKLLIRGKELLGAKSISEVIIKLFETREEILRALRKAEELITSNR